MKSYNIKIMIAWASLLLFSACNDDEFFTLKVPPNPPILTVIDMDRAVAGTYYALSGNSGNATNMDVLALKGSAIADDGVFLQSAGNSTDVLDLYIRNNEIDNGILNSAFNPSYSAIANANQWLQILENNELAGLENANQLPRMQGELYFIRAYGYYNLVKMFCPPYQPGTSNDARLLSLRLAPVTGINDANAPAATVEAIYQAIVNDLLEAKRLLPTTFAGDPFGSYQYGRVNRFGAAALLSRVYLQMGRKTEALAEANFVIEQNGGQYSMEEDPIETWNKGWDGGSMETIWYYATGDTPQRNGLGGSNSNWKIPRRYAFFNWSLLSNNASDPGNPPGGNVRLTDRTLAYSFSMLNTLGFVNADSTPTDAALRDKRFTQLVRYVPGNDPIFSAVPRRIYWNNKYFRGPQSAWRMGAIPQIRLAEMYLTRALLRFEAGNTQGAADDLNVVRRRAWDEEVAGEPYTDIAANQVSAQMIHNERWFELAFEGDRAYYLQANQVNIPNADRGTGSVEWNSPSLYWPTPLRERELNQGL
jgi:starch-binding outer membrane protein, SusD/RagB family